MVDIRPKARMQVVLIMMACSQAVLGEENMGDLKLQPSAPKPGVVGMSDRPVERDEVRCSVIAVRGEVATVYVMDSKATAVRKGAKIMLHLPGMSLEANDRLFFKPSRTQDGVWKAVPGSFQVVKQR